MAEVTQNESQNFTPKQNKLNRKTQHFGKKWIFLKYLTTTVSFLFFTNENVDAINTEFD